MKKNIYALHGFLGESTDWSCFKSLDLIPVDLFSVPHIEEETLSNFGNSFNETISSKNNVLIGYSMGGRLALHALLASEEKWKAAVLISTHPGLQSQKEKTERLKRDRELLNSFLKEDFEAVLKKWETQEIFGGIPSPFVRKSLPKEKLFKSLQNFSLGHQENLRSFISKVKIPLLWLVGSLDKKYVDIAADLTFLHPNSRIVIAENCAHRLPWEDKKEFEKNLNLFLEEL